MVLLTLTWDHFPIPRLQHSQNVQPHGPLLAHRRYLLRGNFPGQQQRAAWKGAVLMLKCRSCFTAQSCWPRLFKKGKWRMQLIEVTVKGSDSQEIQTKFTLKPGLLFLLGSQSNFWNGSSGHLIGNHKAAPWEAKECSAFPSQWWFYLVLHCAGLYGVAQEMAFLLKQGSSFQREEEKGSHSCSPVNGAKRTIPDGSCWSCL